MNTPANRLRGSDPELSELGKPRIDEEDETIGQLAWIAWKPLTVVRTVLRKYETFT